MDPNHGNGTGDMFDLINSFNCLGTSNKEDLVRQFKGFVAVPPSVASFYLEANNWNLQLALNAYMDTQGQIDAPSNSEAQNGIGNKDEEADANGESDDDDESDEDYTDTEEPIVTENILELVNMLPVGPITVLPNTKFQVAWQLRNIASASIPAGTRIIPTTPICFGVLQAWVAPDEIEPGGIREAVVELISPPQPGNYRAKWYVLAPNGMLYGQKIVTDLIVGQNIGTDPNNNNVQVDGPIPSSSSWMNQFPGEATNNGGSLNQASTQTHTQEEAENDYEMS